MTRIEIVKARVAMVKFDAGQNLSREEFESIVIAAKFGLMVQKNRVKRGPSLISKYGLERWSAP